MEWCECIAFRSAHSGELHLLQLQYSMYIPISGIVFMLYPFYGLHFIKIHFYLIYFYYMQHLFIIKLYTISKIKQIRIKWEKSMK